MGRPGNCYRMGRPETVTGWVSWKTATGMGRLEICYRDRPLLHGSVIVTGIGHCYSDVFVDRHNATNMMTTQMCSEFVDNVWMVVVDDD